MLQKNWNLHYVKKSSPIVFEILSPLYFDGLKGISRTFLPLFHVHPHPSTHVERLVWKIKKNLANRVQYHPMVKKTAEKNIALGFCSDSAPQELRSEPST